jgi:VPDSG-CTERM motif
MKALPRKLLRLTVCAIAVMSLFSVRPAQAYTVTLQQVGSNVVANGTGAINLMGLIFQGPTTGTITGIRANTGSLGTGPLVQLNFDVYTGFTGPTSFGSGVGFLPNTGSGDFVGIFGLAGQIFVPQGYVSGAALSDSMTFNSETFASLGVTPGTYVWTWGDGTNQSIMLHIGAVPDAGSTVSLLGFGLLGLAALRRKLPLLRGTKS